MKSFSYHRYPVSHCGGENTTIGALLADASVGGQLEKLAPFIEATTKRSIEFWIGEGNSASCGGMPGVSDTFAAPLWAVDFLATLSKGGVSGMNFHGGPGGSYPPIAFDNGVLQTRPLWYGMLAFSELAANHSRWLEARRAHRVCRAAATRARARRLRRPRLLPEGGCGGTGCDKRPAAERRALGSIEQTGRQCDSGAAPCVLDREYRVSPSPTTPPSKRTALKVMLVHGAVGRRRRASASARRGRGRGGGAPAQLVRLSAPSVERNGTTDTVGRPDVAQLARRGSRRARATESVAGGERRRRVLVVRAAPASAACSSSLRPPRLWRRSSKKSLQTNLRWPRVRSPHPHTPSPHISTRRAAAPRS